MPPCRADNGFLPGVRRGAGGGSEARASSARREILMAYTPPVRYCGRCGAPLAPGATYCGHCGTPVLMQAAAPPAYSYPHAPSVAYPTARPYKLAPALIAGGLV